MTYNSTSIKCGHAVRAGLKLRRPLRDAGDLKRRIYVTEEVSTLLDGEPTPTHFANGKANVVITRFLTGQMVLISQQKRAWKKRQQPTLVQLVGEDEVWELCFREPPPGWRLLGRFLERDVFIGLRLYDRHDIDHFEAANEILAQWDTLFPDIEPLRSDKLDDYIGHVWRLVDDPEE